MTILIDEVMAATHQPKKMDLPFLPKDQQRLARQLRETLIGARRLFLDDDVVAAATVLGVEHPDILLAMLQRARLPFPKMWIEWPQAVALEAQGINPDKAAPPMCGAILEEISKPNELPIYRITEVGITDDTHQVYVSATSIIYCLDGPILERVPSLIGQRSNLARLTGVSKEMMDTTLLGSTYRKVDPDISKYLGLLDSDTARDHKVMADHRLDLCRKLSAFASHTWSPYYPDYGSIVQAPARVTDELAKNMASSIVNFSGTWRFLATVIALVQAREYVMHDETPNAGRRRYVGATSVPYMQYWRVSLKLPRTVVVRQMIDSVRDSLPKPAREVEGYWRVRHKGYDPHCQHVDVSETPNRYRCVHCKRPLFFTPRHVRGDSTLGFVKKDRVASLR